jgi:hypothetical protein
LGPRSRIVLGLHRALLRTVRTPLRHLWAWAYRVTARAAAGYLIRGEPEAAVYGRASFGADDVLPGLSDIDLAVVVGPDRAGAGHARARVARRWERLDRAVPVLRLLLDWPRVYEEPELHDLAGSSAFTYGLNGRGAARSAYAGDVPPHSRTRLLERPGLYGPTAGWGLRSGRDLRPPDPPPDAQRHRIAGWLELGHWWQWVAPVCVDPTGPRTAHLCFKLIAEPARTWLWLAHGERAGDRFDVLRRALRRVPEEEVALSLAMRLGRSLPDSPDPPLAETLPVLVRFSSRIADVMAGQVEGAGATSVRLLGDSHEVVAAWGVWDKTRAEPAGRALLDWRSLVLPELPDDSFRLVPGDPGDVEAMTAAASPRPAGPHAALQAPGLLVLPANPRWRGRLRAVQCAATDPVTFALVGGSTVASFPDVAGWSAWDAARRAVAEHRPRLATDALPITPLAAGLALGSLLTAARAALFLESLQAGEPALALTVTETARRLAERSPAARGIAEEALGAYRALASERTPPSPQIIAATRRLVRGLPAYAD